MFNTEIHNSVKITQQPHDTADAARLYGELEEKAKAAVASATIERLGAHNEVVLVRAAFDQDHIRGKNYLRLLFTVNGVEHDVTVENDELAVIRSVHQTIAHELFEQLLKKLNVVERHFFLERQT